MSRISDARREWHAVKHLTYDLVLIREADQMLSRSEKDLNGESPDAKNEDGIFSVELLAEILEIAPGPIQALARREVATAGIAERLKEMADSNQDDIWIRYNYVAALMGIGSIEDGLREFTAVADLARATVNEDAISALEKLARELWD
jgi:hypothetical protein